VLSRTSAFPVTITLCLFPVITERDSHPIPLERMESDILIPPLAEQPRHTEEILPALSLYNELVQGLESSLLPIVSRAVVRLQQEYVKENKESKRLEMLTGKC
jgi:hypothetical protein